MEHSIQFQSAGDDRSADASSDLRLREESRALAGQDGRTEARDSDRADASNTAKAPGEVFAQEIPPGAEGLVVWDVSPDQAGHLVEDLAADDEADVQAGMAEQGCNDADQDMRRASHANTG